MSEALRAALTAIVGALVIGVFIIVATADVPPKPDGNPVVLVEHTKGYGTAFHVGKGLFVTAAHVVTRDFYNVTVHLADGIVKAEVVALDTAADVAIIKARSPDTLASLSLNCDDPPEIGTPVRAVGNPLNERGVTTFGHVARLPGADRYVMFNLFVAPGMSGGPIIAESGGVVAVVSSVLVIPSAFGASMPLPLSRGAPASEACRLLGV